MYWQGSHVEGGCCYFTCLQRAEKGPVWTNFKEAGFRNLSLGLELLIKGCLGKKHLFLFLVMPSLRLGAKPSLIWSKDSALGASRPKTFSSPSTLWFYEPWQLFTFYLNHSDNCGSDLLVWNDFKYIHTNTRRATIFPCLAMNYSKEGETTGWLVKLFWRNVKLQCCS